MVYVVGSFIPGSCGGFNWYRSPFDAGRAYERELTLDSDAIVWYDTVKIPDGVEDITYYIDFNLLVELEERHLGHSL